MTVHQPPARIVSFNSEYREAFRRNGNCIFNRIFLAWNFQFFVRCNHLFCNWDSHRLHGILSHSDDMQSIAMKVEWVINGVNGCNSNVNYGIITSFTRSDSPGVSTNNNQLNDVVQFNFYPVNAAANCFPSTPFRAIIFITEIVLVNFIGLRKRAI